jgi:hypothetical protein
MSCVVVMILLYNSIITTTHDIYIQQFHYDYTWHLYTTVSLRLHMTSIYNSIITTTHSIYIQQYHYDCVFVMILLYIYVMCSGNDTVVYRCHSLRLHMTSIYNSIITTTHDIYIQQYHYDYTWHLYTTVSLRLHCCI